MTGFAAENAEAPAENAESAGAGCSARRAWRLGGPALVAALTLLAGTMAGCGSDGDQQPDLVPRGVRELHCPLGCAPLRIEVCVDNLGGGSASEFDVTVNGSDRAQVGELAAGDQVCVQMVYGFGATGEPTVHVDSLEQVAEADETNNVLAFPHPSGTACDLLCVDTSASPAPTPPPPRSASRPRI